MEDPAPQSPEGRDRQVHAGFAKLRGQGWEYFMQKYDLTLGRNSKNSAVDIDLAQHGGAMNISRRHARILYNFGKKRFEIEVLGKNGAYVDGELRQPSDGPIELTSQSLIVIGDFPFYFLLPTKKIERAVRRRTSEQNAGGGRAKVDEAESSSEDADEGAVEHEFDNGEEVLDAPPPQEEEEERQGKRKKHQKEDPVEDQAVGDGQVMHGGEKQLKRVRVKVKTEEQKQDAVEPPAVQRKHKQCVGAEGGGSAHLADEGKASSKKARKDNSSVFHGHEEDAEEQKPRKKKKALLGEGGDAPGGLGQEAEEEQEAPHGQRKRKKKVAEAEAARETTPEPFHLPEAASPKQREVHKGTPASPTRAGVKRAAAAEAAAAEGRSHKKASKAQGGEASGVAKGAATSEQELVNALAEILGDPEAPKVPMNRLFSALTARYPEVYERSKNVLTEAGTSVEPVRPWLPLESFLGRHPEQFVVQRLARGKLTSMYASLRGNE